VSIKTIEQTVRTELETAAGDGSALLAVVGLERILGKALRLSAGDIKRAGGLAQTIAKRCAAFLDADKFLTVKLNMPSQSFAELRDLVVGMSEDQLATQVAAIADEDLKTSFAASVHVALGVLQQRVPKTPARYRDERPSEFHAAGFLRAWRTISDPLTVIGDLEMGCLSVDQVRTVQTVYPVLYTLMTNAMLAAVIDKSTDPAYITPYPKLKQIAVLLQQPLVGEDLAGLLSKAFDHADADKPEPDGQVPDVGSASATSLQKTEFDIK